MQNYISKFRCRAIWIIFLPPVGLNFVRELSNRKHSERPKPNLPALLVVGFSALEGWALLLMKERNFNFFQGKVHNNPRMGYLGGGTRKSGHRTSIQPICTLEIFAETWWKLQHRFFKKFLAPTQTMNSIFLSFFNRQTSNGNEKWSRQSYRPVLFYHFTWRAQ